LQKERRINTKLRQPSICKPLQIKIERISTDSAKSSDAENNQNVKNVTKPVAEAKIQQLKELVSKDTTFGSKTAKRQSEEENTVDGGEDGSKKVKVFIFCAN
jgi:hypothetical protein